VWAKVESHGHALRLLRHGVQGGSRIVGTLWDVLVRRSLALAIQREGNRTALHAQGKGTEWSDGIDHIGSKLCQE